VIARDTAMDDLRRRVEDLVYETTARQAPVASDLRTLFTALHVGADLERMGDLADHVARIADRHHPQTTIPAELRDLFGQMAQVADQMAGKLANVLATPDARIAAELDHDDDAMDQLHHDVLDRMLHPDWSQPAQAAIDVALLSWFYERYGDHAVNAGRQVVFLLSGETVSG
jgi:phosphate transport system protein